MVKGSFRFDDLGEGRFALSGDFSFATVTDIFEQSKELFAPFDVLELDLSGIESSDSAGLALLLEWVNWAKNYVREITFQNIPEQLTAIARICEVDDLLRAGERWTGPVDIYTR